MSILSLPLVAHLRSPQYKQPHPRFGNAALCKKYLINMKGESYCKTSNIIKAQKKLLKLNHRLTNIRHNYLHQITAEIINRKPKFIVLEDLNVKGMMKNKHLSEAVAEQCFYEFYRQIEYKSSWR